MMNDENSTPPELKKFRDEIDALDDELIALLQKRTALVEQVRALKKEKIPHLHNLRPGREALMLRRIYEKAKGGNFPAEAVVAMWRLVIGASTAVETRLEISSFATESDAHCYWLAREYFGAFIPTVKQAAAGRVISDILEKKASVGVLPVPGGEGRGAWWPSLVPYVAKGVRIFAWLPFIAPAGVAAKNAVSAVAIGGIVPEPTGSDRTWLVLEANAQASTHGLQSAVRKAGLTATWMGIHDMGGMRRQHLIEADGFVTDDDTAVQKLLSESGDVMLKVTGLGAYALPMTGRKESPDATATKNNHGKPSDA